MSKNKTIDSQKTLRNIPREQRSFSDGYVDTYINGSGDSDKVVVSANTFKASFLAVLQSEIGKKNYNKVIAELAVK